MNGTEFYIDPLRGVVCSRAGHLVTEHPDRIPACPRCGKVLCASCFSEDVRPVLCPLGDDSCPNTRVL